MIGAAEPVGPLTRRWSAWDSCSGLECGKIDWWAWDDIIGLDWGIGVQSVGCCIIVGGGTEVVSGELL